MNDIFTIKLEDIYDLRISNNISGVKRKGNVIKQIVYHKYDPSTKLIKLTFRITTKYRKVLKYRTVNYVKYPIYSDWQSRSKNVNKTIKLSNQNLEDLNFHDDELISEFCEEIILLANDHAMIPSWMLEKYALLSIQNENSKYREKCKKIYDEFYSNESSLKNEKISIKTDLLDLQLEILNKDKKLKRKKKKFEKMISFKPNLLDVLLFGFRIILNSKKRITKYDEKIKKIQYFLEELKQKENEFNNNISEIDHKIIINKTNYDEKNNIFLQEKNLKIEEINKYIKIIKPLNNEISTKDFIPLKDINCYDKENIIGCYIIRNKELNKYYVGQSKNVIKRLGQHFKGTIPKNYIFFEDYANSKVSNKEDLFEIKIIRLSTKDELDRVERELILEYEAETKGYNSTSGNI